MFEINLIKIILINIYIKYKSNLLAGFFLKLSRPVGEQFLQTNI